MRKPAAPGFAVKQSFSTSVGTVEILVDEQSRIVSAYRFDAERRPVAAAIESLDHSDLADVLVRQAGVPGWEAKEIASSVTEKWGVSGDLPQPARHWKPRRENYR